MADINKQFSIGISLTATPNSVLLSSRRQLQVNRAISTTAYSSTGRRLGATRFRRRHSKVGAIGLRMQFGDSGVERYVVKYDDYNEQGYCGVIKYQTSLAYLGVTGH